MDSNNDQVEKIQGEKNALRRQLIVLTILSFVISGLFYGITLAQNPYRKDWERVAISGWCQQQVHGHFWCRQEAGLEMLAKFTMLVVRNIAMFVDS